MEQILLWILAAGALLGGLDLLFGNRFGLGEQFEKGFQLLGPTALSMAGILCLAPLLSHALSATVAPIWRAVGLDPAMLGGILAIDMGGFQMASDLAADPAVGRFAGIVVSATLGCSVSFTIPLGLGMIRSEDSDDFFRGLLIGLGVLPAALFPGALLSSVPVLTAFIQLLPVTALSVFLMWGLRVFPKQTLKGFSVFAKGIRFLSILGLTIGAVQYISGTVLIPELAPLEDAMKIVSGIGIVLLGSLPAAELLQRALNKPLHALGKRLGLNDSSLAGLMIGFVSVTPALTMLKNMDSRGKTMNTAFLVCAASALASHLGFTLSAERSMLMPLLFTKLVGGLLAAVLALILTRKKQTTQK